MNNVTVIAKLREHLPAEVQQDVAWRRDGVTACRRSWQTPGVGGSFSILFPGILLFRKTLKLGGNNHFLFIKRWLERTGNQPSQSFECSCLVLREALYLWGGPFLQSALSGSAIGSNTGHLEGRLETFFDAPPVSKCFRLACDTGLQSFWWAVTQMNDLNVRGPLSFISLACAAVLKKQC